jgi:hypothetical protein
MKSSALTTLATKQICFFNTFCLNNIIIINLGVGFDRSSWIGKPSMYDGVEIIQLNVLGNGKLTELQASTKIKNNKKIVVILI